MRNVGRLLRHHRIGTAERGGSNPYLTVSRGEVQAATASARYTAERTVVQVVREGCEAVTTVPQSQDLLISSRPRQGRKPTTKDGR